jgi:ATP-dependent Clp protease ATP-binding subunit ClpA
MNELKSIVEMKLMELFSQIKKTYNLTTDEGSGIKEFICDKCIDTSNGAREISRIIDQHLKAPISNFYLKNKAKIDAHARGILKIELINDEIKIKLV